MKKFISLMVCAGAVLPLLAAVPEPIKNAGKAATIEERNRLMKEALSSPQYNQDGEAYYEAGVIEMKAYDNDKTSRGYNVQDTTIGLRMAEELMNGYNYFLSALTYDTVPNKKGKLEARNSKKIIDNIRKHKEEFFMAGVEFNNAKKLYPESYDAFMVYGNLPSTVLQPYANEFDPQQVITAFYNAGIVASLSNELEAAANAYRMARLAGSDSLDVYRYEMGSLIGLAQENNDRANEIQPRIEEVALAGIEKFGIEEPLFINNYINVLVQNGENDKALNQLNNYISQNPDNSNLYGLQGWVYEQINDDNQAEAAYRKGAALAKDDFTTLKNASLKLFKIGTQKLNALEGNSAETQAERENLKNNYFLVAQQYANQAAKLEPTDSSIQAILDSLDYALTTYF